MKKNGYIHEIEIKVNKSDLCYLEPKKFKHDMIWKKGYPNYFSFAVPTELIEDSKKMIEKLNPKYGLLEINTKLYPSIFIHKRPLRIHNELSIEYWTNIISRRLSAEIALNFLTKYKDE
jgi:hypothetical protein